MSGRHRVLVVEDEKATAEDLCEIVRALDGDPIVFDNAADALAELDRTTICFAVLDLQIKVSRDSIRGTVAAGTGIVREVRRRYPDYVGGFHSVPIIVVSGHAKEADPAVQVMKDGADDVLQKPLEEVLMTARLREALQRAGRLKHIQCPAPTPLANGPNLVISIPGDRTKTRTRVNIGAGTTTLTNANLRLLLQLMIAKVKGTRVHKADLGYESDQGFKQAAVLRDALVPALGEGVNILVNEHGGEYWLRDDVTVGECAFDALFKLGDHKIKELALALRGASTGTP